MVPESTKSDHPSGTLRDQPLDLGRSFEFKYTITATDNGRVLLLGRYMPLRLWRQTRSEIANEKFSNGRAKLFGCNLMVVLERKSELG
jgi:hypothetical protein